MAGAETWIFVPDMRLSALALLDRVSTVAKTGCPWKDVRSASFPSLCNSGLDFLRKCRYLVLTRLAEVSCARLSTDDDLHHVRHVSLLLLLSLRQRAGVYDGLIQNSEFGTHNPPAP